MCAILIRDNDLYADILYRDEYTDTALDLAGVNGKTGASGNISEDPLFGTDYELSGSTPASITEGGLNGAHSSDDWVFTTDKDGINRSPLDDSSVTGWSMGAYFSTLKVSITILYFKILRSSK